MNEEPRSAWSRLTREPSTAAGKWCSRGVSACTVAAGAAIIADLPGVITWCLLALAVVLLVLAFAVFDRR